MALPQLPARFQYGDQAARFFSMRSLAGLNHSGFAIAAVFALVNAIRRNVNTVFTPPFTDRICWFLETFLTGYVMGVVVLIAVVWTFNRQPRKGWRQYVAMAAAVIVASGLGSLLLLAYETDGEFLSGRTPLPGLSETTSLLVSTWMHYALISLLVAGTWLYFRAEAESSAALAQCALDSARSDQQTVEARLQMLEAQIEPHFLFNTLAHVRRLYEIDAVAGRRMLTNLMEYLAVALPRMRESGSTLEREIGYATAYLEIHRMRMGSRLGVDIHVPASLHGMRMPPLMILTLVENAIKHGIAPRPGGGRIGIHATADDNRMRIEVADTGRGFTKTSGGGTGLANIRGRLAALFGTAASLSLQRNSPRGVVATIVLPRIPGETASTV
jgi:signal transduction histidine kinase